MAVFDRIRARVREKDCFFAIFPDKGFSVLSPMNDKVFPVPGSNTTGNKDIDDGLVTLRYYAGLYRWQLWCKIIFNRKFEW